MHCIKYNINQLQSSTFRLITATVIVADGRPWIPSLTAIPDVQYSAMTTYESVHQATHDCMYQCLQQSNLRLYLY